MKQNQRVYYNKTEWIFIEEMGDKYLLKSTNKNIDNVLAESQDVKALEVRV